MTKMLNEFRQDLVSGDWVLFSSNRSFSIKKFEDSYQPKEECHFEDLEKKGQEIIWYYPNFDSWEIAVIKNKFPGVNSGICGPIRKLGEFSLHDAIGEHDVFVLKDHDTSFNKLEISQISSLIKSYKKRYREITKEGCVKYIMIFHNFGHEAGASIYHPHSQIVSLPILPPDVLRSIENASRFYEENKKNVYDFIVEWEVDQKTRIVYENDKFIAFCPFVSQTPYEVRIFPKHGLSNFERMPDDLDGQLADALLVIMKKIDKALDNPPFNFFIHTAPVEFSQDLSKLYTWHIEILPRVSIFGGLELGAGVDVNVINPDDAAELLRNVKI